MEEEEQNNLNDTQELDDVFTVEQFDSFMTHDGNIQSNDENPVKIKEPPTSSPSNPRKRVNETTNNELAELMESDKLTAMYDEVDTFRLRFDFMYSFIFCKDDSVNDHYYKALKDTIMNAFGCSKGHSDGLDDRDEEIIDNIIAFPDRKVRQAFWFFCIYCVPQLFSWLVDDSPNRADTPPLLASTSRFKFFVRKTLTKKCEDLLNGYHKTFDNWFDTLVIDYIQEVGVNLPEIQKSILQKNLGMTG